MLTSWSKEEVDMLVKELIFKNLLFEQVKQVMGYSHAYLFTKQANLSILKNNKESIKLKIIQKKKETSQLSQTTSTLAPPQQQQWNFPRKQKTPAALDPGTIQEEKEEKDEKPVPDASEKAAGKAKRQTNQPKPALQPSESTLPTSNANATKEGQDSNLENFNFESYIFNKSGCNTPSKQADAKERPKFTYEQLKQYALRKGKQLFDEKYRLNPFAPHLSSPHPRHTRTHTHARARTHTHTRTHAHAHTHIILDGKGAAESHLSAAAMASFCLFPFLSLPLTCRRRAVTGTAIRTSSRRFWSASRSSGRRCLTRRKRYNRTSTSRYFCPTESARKSASICRKPWKSCWRAT